MSIETAGGAAMRIAPKPRQIFALLLLNANKIVSTASLMTELWDDTPPKSAATTLQTYVLHLRKALGAVLGLQIPQIAQEVLTTHTNGYMIVVPPGALDLHAYEELVGRARDAFEANDFETAAARCYEALALWNGPSLADVPAGRLLEMEVMRLEESRLSTIEQRIEADLQLGRHHQLLSELTSLVAQHPMHEGLHEKFMLALYRSGRRYQSLDVYQRLRRSLVDELGIDPSPRIRRLHQQVLESHPGLDSVADDEFLPRRQPLASTADHT